MIRGDTRTSSRQNRPPVVSRELIGRIGHGVGENYVAGSARANIRLDNQGPGRRTSVKVLKRLIYVCTCRQRIASLEIRR
jgi:hypothetical protein